MSRINGEKARAAITRRRRTAQRLKDRIGRTAAGEAAAAKAAAPAAPAKAKKAAKASKTEKQAEE
jgi:hypothetical protein